MSSALTVPLVLLALLAPQAHADTLEAASIFTPDNGGAKTVSLSADGRYAAFSMVLMGNEDVFVKDMQTGDTTLVSAAQDGTPANAPSTNPSISADGRYVAFESDATNLGGQADSQADVFVKDRQTGALTLLSDQPTSNTSRDPAISADGRHVAFWSYEPLTPGDANFTADMFVTDLDSGVTTLVSTAGDGTQGDRPVHPSRPALSADGRYVTFASNATTLPGDGATYQLFRKDTGTGAVSVVSVAHDGTLGDRQSFGADMSDDGRYVAFYSQARNLVADDTNPTSDTFVKDTQTGAITRVSTRADGAETGFGSQHGPAISADGRYVAFWSLAHDLVPGDTNLAGDTFVKDTQTGAVARVSVTASGGQGAGDPVTVFSDRRLDIQVGADGFHVAFATEAGGLIAEDGNGVSDVLVRELQAPAPDAANPPAFGGAPVEGQALTVSTGSWLGAWQPTQYTYQWLRCDADGTNCLMLTGETEQSYTPSTHDVGKRLQVQVGAQNQIGDGASATSSTSDVVDFDTDGDGQGNATDADDDDDGSPDTEDAYPLDPTRSGPDFDGDGEPDNVDGDDDNDGSPDADDAYPLDPDRTGPDFDGDGQPNNVDADDDNDGSPDTEDAYPLDPDRTGPDSDGDGRPNNVDVDDDNDGVADAQDAYPLDPTRHANDPGNPPALEPQSDSTAPVVHFIGAMCPARAGTLERCVRWRYSAIGRRTVTMNVTDAGASGLASVQVKLTRTVRVRVDGQLRKVRQYYTGTRWKRATAQRPARGFAVQVDERGRYVLRLRGVRAGVRHRLTVTASDHAGNQHTRVKKMLPTRFRLGR